MILQLYDVHSFYITNSLHTYLDLFGIVVCCDLFRCFKGNFVQKFIRCRRFFFNDAYKIVN